MTFRQVIIVIIILAAIYFIFDQNAWHTLNDRTFSNVDYTTQGATNSAVKIIPGCIVIAVIIWMFRKARGR